MSAADAPPTPASPARSGGEDLAKRVQALESAIADADSGSITNARKLEALSALDELIPSLPRPDISKQHAKLHELCERLIAQNATEPLRRLTVSVLNSLCRQGDSSALSTFVSKLLKLTSEQNKKVSIDTRVAALDIIGELVSQHGRMLEHYANDIFVQVAKHMKFPEAGARCSAFQCLCKTVTTVGVKGTSTASNIWKMLQKMLQDKSVSVRAATAHALAALVKASPDCVGGASANGQEMAVACIKALATEDLPGAASSECRVAFSCALAEVLAAMSMPMPTAPGDRPKKRPFVTGFASAVDFLEQSVVKGPSSGLVSVNFRAAICLAAVRLTVTMNIMDSATIILVMRSLLNVLEMPSQKGRSSVNVQEDEYLAQTSRHLGNALRQLLLLADSEACLLDVIELGLLPLVSSQISETSRSGDMRMVAVLEALCCACVTAGESFKSIEAKVSKPLLHLVGNHPSPIVQLHATYALRVLAHGSPSQLFQLMSVLLNLVTVQNAEILGTPVKRRDGAAGAAGQTTGATGAISADLQPLLRGLFGHCAALAALNGELFHSKLGVPHDVTSAVLGTSRALLQPHPNTTVSAQRRSCAFLLLEGLMCLGTDWVGQRLTTLFALWKTALGKKPVDRAKVLYQQHAAATPSSDGAGGADSGSGACRDELFSLLCALRSLYAFTLHSHETLLTSYSHLHKILVVFLTNISQLVVALPHPTSPSLRAKYRGDMSSKTIITLALHCEIPDILVAIRSTMYRTFAAMLPTQYSSRFVPLLNMLADDVTRALSPDFQIAELLGHFLPKGDAPLDLVDGFTESNKDGAATVRLAVSTLLSPSINQSGEEAANEPDFDLFSEASAGSYFSGAPREGLGGIEGLLTPWDAWFNPAKSLADQCISAEWEWRCSAVSLLAIIMNASEVSEAPRSAVLLHLLKRKDFAEDGSGGQHGKRSAPQQGDVSAVPSLAVLMYLKEHIKVRGIKCAPPQTAMEQVLQLSIEGLKDMNPAVRRLHVELLSVLFYVHHQLPESPIVPSILSLITGESPVEGAQMRSAVALLSGAVLRTFAWGNKQLAGSKTVSKSLHCPYMVNITPALLKHAKETTQPVRLWMLHAIHLSMQAAGVAFAPFLKDALRLATAHLLADFFEAPLVLWVIAELVQSAASLPYQAEGTDSGISDDHVSRILGIWNELKHVHYAKAGSALSFAIVRTEVLCISTASAVMKLAPLLPSQHKEAQALALRALRDGAEEAPSAVRAAAAMCLQEMLELGQVPTDSPVLQEPLELLMLLEGAQPPEAEALRELLKALVRLRGLEQLPTWLQALREVILALSPQAKGAANVEQVAPAREEPTRDETDDSAAMAGSNERSGDEKKHRVPHSATKVFAVSCLQLLVEQADPEDAAHFQTDARDASARPSAPQHRLVQYLEMLVGLAAHASSSDEESLAAAGLRLMLLLVRRFRNTRDVQSQTDTESCPLLLVQYEAQVTTCIRHNSRPETNPAVVCLALELLRDVIVAQACNSKQRLIGLLTQPFTAPAFEPDPMFCEFASTRTFLVRLQGACEILDSNPEEQALLPRLKDISRWLELALRDCAVLLAGLPLQSIKTYQPACFCLADYKVVQPCFREAIPSILRGVCALCDERRTLQSAPDIIPFALGVPLLLLQDPSSALSDADVRIHLRTIRQVLLFTSDGASALIGLGNFVDALAVVWRHVFKVPERCRTALPELLQLLHTLSGAIWKPQKRRDALPTAGEDAGWLEALLGEAEDARKQRNTVGAYCLHAVAAALRSPAVVEDAASVSLALEIFVWWLGDALPSSLASSRDSGGLREREDEIVAAALEEEEEPSQAEVPEVDDSLHAGPHCCWLWLLFHSPFPLELMQAQPAVTQKYWQMACAVLSAPGPSQGLAYATKQLLYLALIASKLCKSFLAVLDEGGESLSPAKERSCVLTSALLVPSVSALCSVLQQAPAGAPCSERAKTAVSKSLCQVREVFTRALAHSSAKVAQTGASSACGLLQGPGCAALCPVLLPCLVTALIRDKPDLPQPAVEAAWGAISAAVTGQHSGENPSTLAEATTAVVLRLALHIADYTAKRPGSFGAHRSPMAQCLVQLARVDPQGLKAEVATISPEGQQAIQQLLREHVSAASRGASTPISGGTIAPLAAKKIELKLKF